MGCANRMKFKMSLLTWILANRFDLCNAGSKLLEFEDYFPGEGQAIQNLQKNAWRNVEQRRRREFVRVSFMH